MENLISSGQMLLYNNKPFLIKGGENLFSVELQAVDLSTEKMSAKKFEYLHNDGKIIAKNDLVSVQVGYDFCRGKIAEITESGLTILTGGEKEKEINISDLKIGDKISFPFGEGTFKGEVTELRDQEIEFQLKGSGMKYHINRAEIPETALLDKSKTVQIAFDENYRGTYKLKAGQKYDFRELPQAIFGLDKKSITPGDLHLLLQGKTTNNLYEFTKSGGEKYQAVFNLYREDGKIRVNVTSRNAELTLGNSFSDHEKEKLHKGEVCRKDFGYGDTYVKIDTALNKLIFIKVDEINNLFEKSGAKENLTSEQKNELIQNNTLVLNNKEKETQIASLDWINKTLDISTEYTSLRLESFKADSSDLERSNSLKR
ncbi:MAG: hypothetical protein K0M50_17535 [Prolixibacteraceae bacterium]|nr:hypothetical protein [Prolixibacteraceae bacterium]